MPQIGHRFSSPRNAVFVRISACRRPARRGSFDDAFNWNDAGDEQRRCEGRRVRSTTRSAAAPPHVRLDVAGDQRANEQRRARQKPTSTVARAAAAATAAAAVAAAESPGHVRLARVDGHRKRPSPPAAARLLLGVSRHESQKGSLIVRAISEKRTRAEAKVYTHRRQSSARRNCCARSSINFSLLAECRAGGHRAHIRAAASRAQRLSQSRAAARLDRRPAPASSNDERAAADAFHEASAACRHRQRIFYRRLGRRLVCSRRNARRSADCRQLQHRRRFHSLDARERRRRLPVARHICAFDSAIRR